MDDRRPTGAGPSRAHGRFARAALAFGLVLAVAQPVAQAVAQAATEPAPPAEPVAAVAARIEQQKDRARLVFETTAEVRPAAFPVADPYRIVVDLPETAFRLDPEIGRPPKEKRGADDLVTSFRFGQLAPGRSRIVIDLARPAKIMRAESETTLDKPRLVVELAASDATSFAAEAARLAPAAPRAAAAEPAPAPAPAQGGKPMLVIDPGHGGVDVGAAGPHGEQEKTIVLEFARALQAKIETQGRLRVALTRNEDAFMALDERVRVARQAGAELFLSIHADTLGEASVEGATVYTVSARASDAEAAKIAEKENFADRAAGLEPKSEDAGEVGDILYDLTRRETRAYSRVFARTLIAYWRTVGHLNKNPSRSAGFVVLKAFDIPSVLLELGYLSSARDLSRLVSPEWRERAAEATAQAIERYFDERQEQAREQQAQAGATPQAMAARPQ
ncbi:N-acetylmuramoyl-L-alanine amidase [Methylosinus sp. Ce-a6]|uniref:N-acetylmuramoyl-L-alanine amidase n=1 Tax=Methylosinus sp. Ce-a6 TaxID=2172005 RepID=UPI0013597C60|nr:N-acetylmuramoyl-L-alanine amidase [Methylosinus sp. Ce-a6]